MGLTYAISIVNWIFDEIFLFFFTDFKILMFRNKTVKIAEILNQWNSLKTRNQTSYHIEFCIICSQFYYGKNGKFRFKKKRLFVHV